MALRQVTLADGQRDRYSWWTSLKHGGLLLTPSKIGSPERLPTTVLPVPLVLEAQLRRHVTRVLEDRRGAIGGLLDTVLEGVCGLGALTTGEIAGQWIKGSRVGEEWSRKSMTGKTIRPQRVWLGAHGAALPVFVDVEAQRLGIGESRRFLSRVTEWLRQTSHRLALATNGVQWRLIYAGLDYGAFAEWDVNLWFEEGRPAPQADALRVLLNPKALTPRCDGALSPLLGVIEASHRGQAEVSAELGERVRSAVEILIDDLTPVLGNLEARIRPQDVYRAATRIVMRMVVVLFAEARDLLPRDIVAYHDSYGINGLREILERAGGGEGEDRLRSRSPSAWPRLLSLFRLVCYGSPHESLEIKRYGGELFRPGKRDSNDPVSVALHVMENATDEVSDRTVYRMLELLCRTRAKVQQGRAWTWVETPVDFSDLGSEYIGMLYEGLLDYELRQADDDPVVFLNLGDQPALPISRLESLDDSGIAKLLEKAKLRSTKAVSEEEESREDAGDDEATEDEDNELQREEADSAHGEDVAGVSELDSTTDEDLSADEGDLRRAARERVHAWAVKAVKVGGVVRRPRGRDARVVAQYEVECDKAADRLYSRIVLPGEWYLVRWGGTRKGSGTFYTRRELTVPTARRTLEPLVYEVEEGDPAATEGSAKPKKTVHTPEEILSVKACDPACGSASFLIAALDYLTDALVESLYVHGRIPAHDADTAVALPSGANAGDSLAADLIPCPPSDPDFDRRLRARLMRHVVERCIYGVDLDPLAVELARIALWVKTMDRDLPFTFLDHKIKVGNSLVGCWLDRLEDYPLLAWSREGGDKDYSGVNYAKDSWTKAIRVFRNDRVKNEMRTWLQTPEAQRSRQLTGPSVFELIHRDLEEALDRVHSLSVSDPEGAEEEYRTRVLGHPSLAQVKRAMDRWCAVWFWPAEELGSAPSPMNMTGDERDQALSDQIAREYRFFHWEVEFPDVFNAVRTGFDAVIGNPPWDIQKPNSKEYFSNIDPLYRSYGKQKALHKQKEYFRGDRAVERGWLSYRARFKALSNWVKHSGAPFGNGEDNDDRFNLGAGSEDFHLFWSQRRSARKGYSDPAHPFIHQGSADINTYKMFLEQSHGILRCGGRLGMIVPSGVYTDKGTTAIRNLFLNHCRWEWLFAFENREGIFEIDNRFKFCPVIVEKGGRTTSHIETAFMRRELGDWDRAEGLSLPYSVDRVKRFSPTTHAILELRSKRDMEILDKIYSNSVMLGDNSPDGWQIRYATEFHMTNDSQLFPPRPVWEAQGYRSDEYGRLLKGKWRAETANTHRWESELGIVLSQDGELWIDESDIEGVALPLYQGVMIWQYDFATAAYGGGSGLGARWAPTAWETKRVSAQYFISMSIVADAVPFALTPRLAFRDVQNATNQRTMISAVVPGFPCGNKVPTLRSSCLFRDIALLPALNSFPLDRVLRSKMNQNTVNWFYAAELPVPYSLERYSGHLLRFIKSLALAGKWFAPQWLMDTDREKSLDTVMALAPAERLRTRCLLDAVMAELYGLDMADLAYLFHDCDHPVEIAHRSRDFDPKGFWRVDKDKDPELRHTVLTLVAFHGLKQTIKDNGGDRLKGIEAFCSMNDGEGWMLPETLRLADYGLGHDERARKPQPVRERLGPRFFPWQLEASPEESWKECEIHARNLLGEYGFKRLMIETCAQKQVEEVVEDSYGAARTRDCGLGKVADAERRDMHIPSEQPSLFGSGQKDLFGEQETYPTERRRRRK